MAKEVNGKSQLAKIFLFLSNSSIDRDFKTRLILITNQMIITNKVYKRTISLIYLLLKEKF